MLGDILCCVLVQFGAILQKSPHWAGRPKLSGARGLLILDPDMSFGLGRWLAKILEQVGASRPLREVRGGEGGGVGGPWDTYAGYPGPFPPPGDPLRGPKRWSGVTRLPCIKGT